MIKLNKSTIKARGCKICTDMTAYKKYGTQYDYLCSYEECPYSELNKFKNYMVDTHKETMKAEIRMNDICRRLVEEQGD